MTADNLLVTERDEEARKAFREKLQSLSFRARVPGPKVTYDHTDQTINTVTEHWDDRQDVHVKVREPFSVKVDKDG